MGGLGGCTIKHLQGWAPTTLTHMGAWIVKIGVCVVGWDTNVISCMHTCVAEPGHHLVRCGHVRYGRCGVRHVPSMPLCRRNMMPQRRRSAMPHVCGMLLTAHRCTSCSIPPCRANCKGNKLEANVCFSAIKSCKENMMRCKEGTRSNRAMRTQCISRLPGALGGKVGQGGGLG